MSGDTLAQAAYSRIKQDILEGRIAPDSLLSERDLAERLGISRTPLRSAMSRLVNERVVDRLANGALIVRTVTAEQLLDIVQLRRTLESEAAARAAGFGLTDELSALRRPMAALAEGADFDVFWHLDEQFHLAVARAARLQLLPAILTEQRAIARRCTISRSDDRFADQAREHLAVIDAIAAGDPDAARRAMALHFDHVRARFLEWFTNV